MDDEQEVITIPEYGQKEILFPPSVSARKRQMLLDALSQDNH